ncbi:MULTISPECIES: GntR family transcriptional regulator [unclassified Microbacterium]|uniref:GntR family transcriptional regulator n=1 Tax=unclassified Microbacterium TaxID=2609290 RepID=UPI0010FE8E4F|nr:MULTISPECIES: GntR family transcriptional regulator [unclassified Microbacterium]MBT9607460.1 GntR family transcriptional regulator [Microbacterium sp.]TLF30076.1 GntR family transcriptional regulator [Microbacterium sp. 5K110]
MSALSSLPPVPAASRREKVAEILREAITAGDLEPGQKLTELDLAAQLGTSRAPIREALRQLEQEGLVVSFPYRGTEVLGVSQEEIENVLVPIRVALERFAFEKAMQRLTDDDLANLNLLVDSMEEAASVGDLARLADDDIRFHEAIVVLSGQQHCLQIWRTIQPRVRAYFRRDASYYSDSRFVAQQHRELIDALRSGDSALGQESITDHIRTHFSPNPTEPSS